MTRYKTFRAELGPTLRLALPLVLAELGWMSMAIVDTMMVGRLPNSAVAIAAVSLGGILVNVLAFFGGGLLIGLDTLVSQAFGSGQREDCHRSLLHGIYLSLALAPLLMAPVWFFEPLLRAMRIAPDVIALAVPYSKAMAWGTLPLLLYFAVRRCMQAMNMVRPVAFALVTANLINAGWQLDPDLRQAGSPRYGRGGFWLVHCLARIYLSLSSRRLSPLVRPPSSHATCSKRPSSPTFARIRRLIALGFPAAMQITLESWRFCAGDGADRPLGRRFPRQSSNRAEHRLLHLHGSAGHLLSSRGARWPSHRSRRFRKPRRTPAGPPFFSALRL